MRARTVSGFADTRQRPRGSVAPDPGSAALVLATDGEVRVSQIVLLAESDAGRSDRRVLSTTAPPPGATATEVGLQGEWDISGRPALSELLSRLIAQRDTDVIIDLSGATFVDNAILRV